MSSPLAIAGVTAVLKDLLNNGLVDHNLSSTVGPVQVSARPLDRIVPAGGSADPNQLNLFLYHVALNAGWRNVGLPSRDDRGQRVSNPPLALDLFYLLTAYGDKDFHAEILLGYAMQLLHETPVLTRDAIRAALRGGGALDPAPVTGAILPSDWQSLAAADLAEQVEQIKIAPHSLNTEELSKLWTAFQAGYRPSAAYQVSVVLIESHRPTRASLPVRERQFRVLPFQRPFIGEVSPQTVEVGSNLVVSGQHLAADVVKVRFGGTETVPATVTSDQIEAHVPAGLAAGVNTVQILHQLDFGTGSPSEPHRLFESNVAAFIVAPKLTVPAQPEPVFGPVARGTDFTLTVAPPVGRAQDVRLLVGNRAILLPARPMTDPPTTAILKFAVPKDFPTGEFLVRLQVDGAQSKLALDPTQDPKDPLAAYLGPKVTIVCNNKCLRSASIALAAAPSGVEATVTIQDETTAPMPNAEVAITWTLPEGTRQEDVRPTDASGEVKFTITGGSGLYRLTVSDIIKKDFAFDQRQSLLEKNITI